MNTCARMLHRSTTAAKTEQSMHNMTKIQNTYILPQRFKWTTHNKDTYYDAV